jgi:hypothetical protein
VPGRLRTDPDGMPLHIAGCRAILPRIADWDYRANALKETNRLLSHLLNRVLGQGEAGPEAAYRATLGDDLLGDCPSHSSTPPFGTPGFYADIKAMIGRRSLRLRQGGTRTSDADATEGQSRRQELQLKINLP